jgi:hypothetical protein
MVAQEVVRQIPVTTYKMVTEERVEQIPVKVCKMVAVEETVRVPRCVEKRIPVTYNVYTPRVVCARVPIDPCTGADLVPMETVTTTGDQYYAPPAESAQTQEPAPAAKAKTDAADVDPKLPPNYPQPKAAEPTPAPAVKQTADGPTA